MELTFSFALIEISLVLCEMLFQKSAALSLPKSVASVFRPIKPYDARPPTYHLLSFPFDHVTSNPSKLYISSNAHAPFGSSHSHSVTKHVHNSKSSPPLSTHPHHGFGKDEGDIALRPHSYRSKGPALAPLPYPCLRSKDRTRKWPRHKPARLHDHSNVSCSTATSPTVASGNKKTPAPLPTVASRNKKTPAPLPTLPSPSPPNEGCGTPACTEPLTYLLVPGAPCGCVLPIVVKLRLDMPIEYFFPRVSELAKEIADGISLNRDQVRIVGANAADREVEKTDVLVNLVPLNESFEYATAFSIYDEFWRKGFPFNISVFGVYEVLYVNYTGLPPSPSSRASSSDAVDPRSHPDSGNENGPLKPFGVDVPRRRKNKSDNSMMIVIALSSISTFVVCMAFVLLLVSKCSRESEHGSISGGVESTGDDTLTTPKTQPGSGLMSITSSLLGFTGTAKVFAIDEIRRAVDNFSASRILGEGGSGLVYGGILDDGRKVAVKVLKRADCGGGREFLAEVEMLGRLHHRNLVKLIGVCAEDRCRCLVYELVPNGSVESHLHGVDKEIAPLDWNARMKIALGTARALAYLHEDSSPRVIHRDFKSSNILLEHDYTPKVSDFGLARAAIDEGNKHVSTHIMGTFGYLAPEYAMTGHLLVKSDVYSYGVVLLELLTGRKPVDLSRHLGQENLVSWARPVLEAQCSLHTILDPCLKPAELPLDSFSHVAAIAAMCVQPEPAHRPLMGEVVQALKLFCNEGPAPSDHQDLLLDVESVESRGSGEVGPVRSGYGPGTGERVAFSSTDLTSGFEERESESFGREFYSAPLRMGRKRGFWDRVRRLSGRSTSEHEYFAKL